MAVDLRLVPLDERHLDDMAALADDPEVQRFTRVPVPPPPGFARSWLARYAQGRRDGTNAGWATLDPDGRFVGLALAPAIDADAREVELGYIVAPAARGRGVGSGMLRELTRWAFAERGAQRAYLLIAPDNAGSQRVAERCGYVLEGVLRSVHLKGDLRTDMQLWSRLPSDPEPDPAVSAALRAATPAPRR